MSESQNQMIGVSMFARIFGKSEDTIRDLERRGVITAVRDSANRRQFSEDQVPRLIAYYANREAA